MNIPAKSSLFTSPLAPLLERLFAEADQSRSVVEETFQTLTKEERAAIMADHRTLYGMAREHYLAVSKETAGLLYLLARATTALSIVEFGTSFGISTLYLAAALHDNGGGVLIGSEFEPSKAAKARENIKAAGFADLVEIREGDALETLSRDLPQRIDLVLLDGAKSLYPQILALLEPHFVSGSLIVADNADDSPEYLKKVRDPANGYLSLPFAEDVELSMKL
ncbi:putative O-methyltransferase YrrM [Rhizomicrobium palustre]|uniref:Putative O-methyltransferase YrrM n=1 Tax=Rhizomicrobium palustre TaxID=189966 RepID=A0A846MY93_9PROT|nr:class I SAM-dependent methyltransferase [Rhizomicrobium palustre]NIK88091.1 putative O-methyltransferase YrrM [Rhizomicrobium palustre]